jgi:hypothetical protein
VLPAFDDFGYLPHGIHLCSLDEVVERFGSGSAEREVETQELCDFVEWARRSGIRRVIVNGSYVTSKEVPNDVDIVALPGADYPCGETECGRLENRWPFLQVFVATNDADVEQWALGDFGTDRHRRPKGVVEVML